MAPMAMATTYTPKFLKRPLPPAQTQPSSEAPPSKRIKRDHIRFNRFKYDLQRAQRKEGFSQDGAAVQTMLERSIGQALEAVGFGAAESAAMQTFRQDVEEYMAHWLAIVRQSMLSSRRVRPLPQDFLQALHLNQLSLRSLLPHLDPPVPPARSQFRLRYQAQKDDGPKTVQSQLLSKILDEDPDETAKRIIPSHFPILPSRHTYKATPQFTEREQDPRKIRERATEEARSGEEALRRLVAAASERAAAGPSQAGRKQIAQQKRQEMWQEAMQAVTEEHDAQTKHDSVDHLSEDREVISNKAVLPAPLHGRAGATVNAERKYWRTPAKR